MRAAAHRTTAHRTTARAPQQRGAALLVILALVLTLGLMGLYMYSSSRTQYQLVGNVQYSEQAFNMVESSVATAENWLSAEDNSKDPAFESYSTTTPHLYPIDELATRSRVPKTMEWTNSNSLDTGSGNYLIEQLGRQVSLQGSSIQKGQQAAACRQVNVFRIHTQSASVKGTTRMVETLYAADGC
jgi:Tfp pilus assembly protein PilX